MYDTTIAAKLLGQLNSFLGKISPHFRKPVARFIGDMMYGIMSAKDVKLSSVVRALKEEITPKKVEGRLSRMLSSEGLEGGLHDVIAAEPVEDRGHHPLRQAVVQPGGHTPFQVRQDQGSGRDRPRDHILQHDVDRKLG